jgi:hypothetical protein|tara:strand:+ start:665 stop:2497 length:1833 start_codon:yes stop_codon:yes gene_type:complete
MRNIGGLISGSGVKRISDGSAFKAGGASTYTLARISGRNYPFGNYHTADSQGAIGTGGSGYSGGWMLPNSMDQYYNGTMDHKNFLLRYEDNKFLRFYNKISGYNIYCNAVDYTPTMNEAFPGVKPNVKTDQHVGPAAGVVRAAELPPGGTARFIWAMKLNGTDTGWHIRTATGINAAGTLLGLSPVLHVFDNEYRNTAGTPSGNIALIPIDNRYVIFTRPSFHQNGTQPFYIEVIDTNPTTPVRNSRVALTSGTHYPSTYMAGWCPLQQKVYTCHTSTQASSSGWGKTVINQFNWTGTALVRDNSNNSRSGSARPLGSADGDADNTWANKSLPYNSRGGGAFGHFPKQNKHNYTTDFVGGWIWMSYGHMIAYHANSNSFINLGMAWSDWPDESSPGAAGMGTSYSSVAAAEAQQGVLNSKIDNIYGLWDGTKSYTTFQQPPVMPDGNQQGNTVPVKLDENNWVAYGTPPVQTGIGYYVPFWFDFSKRKFNWEKGRPSRIDSPSDVPSAAGGAGNYTVNAFGYAGYPQRPLTGTYSTGGNTVVSNGQQIASSVSMLGTFPIPTTGGSMQSAGGGHGKAMVGSQPAHLIHWGGYYRATCIGKYDVTYDVIER